MAIKHTLRNRKYQQGQALIYGIFVMVGGLAALFFLFNTGQLTREKTKLVNTADAVAYSAGVMHARTLNYMAYTNRAMVANTVAIAQLVSLASWVTYVKNTEEYSAFTRSNVANPMKYPAFFPGYSAIERHADELNNDLLQGGTLEQMVRLSDQTIQAILVETQLHAYQHLSEERQLVMDEVARANYLDGEGGIVSVDVMPNSVSAFERFVTLYTGDARARFADVAERAAKEDEFQDSRSWQLPALYNECYPAPGPDWIERRGGTELLGLDEWKAMDTLSEREWRWVPYANACVIPVERVAGWGGQAAAEDSGSDLDPTHYDASPAFNPAASLMAQASSNSWDYSGIPNFYELAERYLGSDENEDEGGDDTDDEPELRFAIRLRRAIGQTVTSEGRAAIRSTPRLNAYQARPAGEENALVAVSTAEVFFRRPSGESAAGHELGSLFNPYWQVRLVHDQPSINQAREMQRVSLP